MGGRALPRAQTQASTMIDVGGYYHFKNPDEQFLFATATPSPGKPRTTPMWACTGRGEKISARRRTLIAEGYFRVRGIMSDTDTVRRCRGVAPGYAGLSDGHAIATERLTPVHQFVGPGNNRRLGIRGSHQGSA